MSKIEVEKKFILNREDKDRLLKGADFISEKVFTDIYYDDEAFSLTSKDFWFRNRDGKFELKTPMKSENKIFANQYREIEDEDEIRKILKIHGTNNLDKDLLQHFSSFCVCKTTRLKYRKNGFVIDLDLVDYGDFNYDIAEIELMVDNEEEISGALQKIAEFANEHKLKIGNVKGKVVEYMIKKRPKHYKALVDKGVIID